MSNTRAWDRRATRGCAATISKYSLNVPCQASVRSSARYCSSRSTRFMEEPPRCTHHLDAAGAQNDSTLRKRSRSRRAAAEARRAAPNLLNLPQIVCQVLSQQQPRPVQARFEGRPAGLEDLRGLAGRELLDVAQDENHPHLLRQPLDA